MEGVHTATRDSEAELEDRAGVEGKTQHDSDHDLFVL